MTLNKLVKGLMDELNKVSKSSTIVGQVRDAGAAKVVPLNKVSIAFGTGTGGAEGKRAQSDGSTDADVNAGGAGGAMMVEPRAFVVVGDDGQPYMLALGRRGQRPEVRRGIAIGDGEEITPQLEPAAEAPKLPHKTASRSKK